VRAPDPTTLAACVEAWFGGVRVAMLPPVPSVQHLKQRIGDEGQVQLHCGDIHNHLKKVKPRDAFCLVAYTMIDLYPRDSWNFCFGGTIRHWHRDLLVRKIHTLQERTTFPAPLLLGISA